ncbi:TonB-dependent receptor plug [Rhodomicrobium vannielii ATCC 17100]|uniref:TonB-dependent receptor plug n=1 Tax=Rhodomicrobium vannielii (strain ATCC 17100 / DSM 162 / LMG 4299 / NCIMB 10020 / ATH 3.1.1) TaxID=648757 RepID=E3I4W0_RHOVT|nr:TonB-dependent receptor [Rhodomicrobium vannielii]ADP72782.1 TonB-dependent receptor plug [Rhodomicrobium vannielii ATCC 17100]
MVKAPVDRNNARIATTPTTAQNGAPDSGVPGANSAQNAGSATTAGATIQDVIVTARLREENSQDVPIPTTALSGETLNREHHATVKDFTQKAPSLTVNAPNARQTSIAIRGLGKNSANEALEGSVGVIVDGVFISSVGMSWADFSDVEQIEILRGPQGTLLGKNTTLGVLAITSKAPSFTPEKEVEVTYGNRDLFVTKASATGPVIDDKLAYRASVYFNHQDGFLENQQPGGEAFDGASDRWGGRLQFLYTPNANVTNRTIIDHGQSNEPVNVNFPVRDPQTYSDNGASRGNTYTSRLARFSYQQTFNSWDSANLDGQKRIGTSQNGVSTQTDWRTGGYTVTSISAYRDFAFDALNDSDSTPLSISRGGTLVDAKQYSQELRVTSPKNVEFLGQKFDYQTGLYALRNEVETTSRTTYGTDAGRFYASTVQYNALSAQALSDSLNGVFLRAAEHPNTTSLAAYGQTTWHATDKADLTLGLRNTYEEKTNWIQKWYVGGVDLSSLYSGNTLNYVNSIRNGQTKLLTLGTGPLVGETIYADSWSWLINPSYKITDDILGYFSVSSGEKSGAVQFDKTTGAPANVDPEKTLDYELGLKTSWLDRKLTLNPNLFHTQITDYQAQLSTILAGQNSATSYLGNVSGVRLRGVEVEGNYVTPIEGLRLTFSGAYNDAIYSDFKNAPCATDLSYTSTQVCDFSGKRLSGAPRWIANAGFDYTREVADGYTAFFFVSETFRTRANLNTSLSVYGWQDEYFLTNAGVGIRPDSGAWDLSVWGKNIFDTHYFTNLSSLSSTSSVSGTPGDPLTFGITFRTKL